MRDPDDDGDFEADDPPTTAEPMRDEHPALGPPLPPALPRAPIVAQLRPQPAHRHGDSFEDDGVPTMIDPHVPTGADHPAGAFQPTARIDDHRRTADLAKLRTTEPTDDLAAVARRALEPTSDLGPAARRALQERASNPAKPSASADATRTIPGKPSVELHRTIPDLPPRGASRPPRARTASTPPRAPASPARGGFDPHARIDDSSRTARWDRDSASVPVVSTAAPYSQPSSFVQPPPAFVQHSPPYAQAPLDPMRAISMKTPHDDLSSRPALPPRAPVPQMQMRPMAEVIPNTPAHGMGRLAPPHDPALARKRRTQDLAIWGSLAVITAAIVTLVIWLLAT